MICIYKLTNLVNGKIYIGQTKDYYRRMKEYRCCNNSLKRAPYPTPIMKAIHKYKIWNFSMQPIEVGLPDDKAALDEAERKWIKFFNSTDPNIGYNANSGGHAGSVMSDISKKKMSEHSFGFIHTEEEKLRRSKAICLYYKGSRPEDIKLYNSAKDATDFFGNTRSEVTKAIKRGSLLRGYYIFYRDNDRRLECYNEFMEKKKTSTSRNGLREKSIEAYTEAFKIVDNAMKKLNAETFYVDTYSLREES